jgi:hypothetical protein
VGEAAFLSWLAIEPHRASEDPCRRWRCRRCGARVEDRRLHPLLLGRALRRWRGMRP